MKISFDNTEVAFSFKSDNDLKKSYFLFRIVSNPFFVSLGKSVTTAALFLRIPISWIIKPTIFQQFCGGETVAECAEKVDQLKKNNVFSILDYSIEGKNLESDFDNFVKEITTTIITSKLNNEVCFSVFKPTAICRFALLEKKSSNEKLNQLEQTEFERARNRFHSISKTGYENGVPVFFDSEESWIQPAIDEIANELMALYNKERAIIYNTFQLYRKDRLNYLRDCVFLAERGNYILGAKLVRGAYMEKERERAQLMNYPSPIHDLKEQTDLSFDQALEYCVRNINKVSFCCASHNEKSSMYLVELMNQNNFPNNHPHIYFSQLLGMSDHITFNLAAAGYNVSKYVPYGPIREVLPYLIRRAQENTSVKGQTTRELQLILKEIERRNAK